MIDPMTFIPARSPPRSGHFFGECRRARGRFQPNAQRRSAHAAPVEQANLLRHEIDEHANARGQMLTT